MSTSEDRRFAQHAAELRARGPEALDVLPEPIGLRAMSAAERHAVLEGLRLELYAIASIVADGAVQRARRTASEYPPYGLAKSMHSQSRMVVDNPGPFEKGSIGDFHALGRAYLDTMVFQLDRHYKEQFASEQGWILHRLEQLLALFRIDANPAAQARLKDGFSFLYGGLQFGVSVCAQLAEVMARLLAPYPDMSSSEKAKVLIRSVRAANRLAALNLDHIIPEYQSLLEPSGWMAAENFEVDLLAGRPTSIDLRDEAFHEQDDRPTTFSTQGCPARRSPSGGQSAIATLWRWCVELSRDLGLLGQDDTAQQEAGGSQQEPG